MVVTSLNQSLFSVLDGEVIGPSLNPQVEHPFGVTYASLSVVQLFADCLVVVMILYSEKETDQNQNRAARRNVEKVDEISLYYVLIL